MEAGSSPVSMERVVVFPAPLWPSRTVIWPSYRFRFRSLTAALPLFPTLNTCGRGRGGPGHCRILFYVLVKKNQFATINNYKTIFQQKFISCE